MNITNVEIQSARDEIARIRERLSTLWFKGQEAEEVDSVKGREAYRRYMSAMDEVDEAMSSLQNAIGYLR